MLARSRLARLLFGFVLLLAVLVIGFWLAYRAIPSWGAHPDELSQVLPGDEILANPPVDWVNAVTIAAAPEEVWPWIIQMGDSRGGYYSFSFIERMFMRAFGYSAEEARQFYVNADRVHPEWQTPPIGQGMILDAVVIKDYEPGRYLLASATDVMGGLGWTWLWHITPTEDRNTRLVVHMRIQPPVVEGQKDSPIAGIAMDLASFMMEKNMLEGIQLRAEGRSEPAYQETLEIILWLTALGIGGIAGVLYILRSTWQRPLLVALASVVALLVFTYPQPALWIRVIVDLLLLTGLYWAFSEGRETVQARKTIKEAAIS